MMKIGIVTLYGLFNYGNRLQAFALSQIIRKLGHDVRDITQVRKYAGAKAVYFGVINKCIKRTMLFYLFYRRNIKTTYESNYKDEDFDYIVCGSDQIWNVEMAATSFYFADFTLPEKRLAYAASFGTSVLPDSFKEQCSKYLSEMKAISVREHAGAEIVKELIGKDVPVLLDPTLLLDKAEWQKVSHRPRFYNGEKYILTYFLGNVSDSQRKYIENIASKNGLKIISLEVKNHNKYWYSSGPAEFLWLIEHCELMCTDSFHGSVFSVLMDVPFIVFDREDKLTSMNSRINTLLSTLKLEDRRYRDQQANEVFKKDYSHVPKILEHERKRAIDYLRNNIKEHNNQRRQGL